MKKKMKISPIQSESDAGDMSGYDPNLGMKKGKMSGPKKKIVPRKKVAPMNPSRSQAKLAVRNIFR